MFLSRPPPESPPETPPPDHPDDTLLSLWRRSWLPFSGAVLLAGALGYYVVGTATASLIGSSSSSSPSPACSHDPSATPTGRPPALSGSNAEQFDRDLDTPEWWMGISSLRARIASRATGHVLELAVGSGRNFQHYDWEPLSSALEGRRPRVRRHNELRGITSFTGLDISVDMLDVARKKLVRTVPPMASWEPVVKASTMADHTGGQLSYLHGYLRLVNSDAHRALPPPPASRSGKYDTIIQTFGLCSVSDPVGVLTNLASAVKPDTGRIFLLEHGKGRFGIVNGLLDRNAGKHFDKYGCWWNRDIQALVEEAAEKAPGLEIVTLQRPKILQMGTLFLVELKVADKPQSTSAGA